MIQLNSPLKPDLKRLNKYLTEVNDRGWYTNFGPLHNEFKLRLEDYLGVSNLLLVNNGTTALQVAGRTLGIDNVVTTPFSFVATTSAFAFQGDQVSFSDINKDSLNLCPNCLEQTLAENVELDAIVATHVYGNPCDVARLEEISARHNKKLIYDAAHAFGVKIGSSSVLSYGDASTLSFHATKVFHSIEGGAVVFKNSEDYAKAKEIINFGIDGKTGSLNHIGINGKLNEYQAAVGLVNLEVIDDVIEHRVHVFEYYISQLKDLVGLQKWHSDANFNAAYMPIILKNRHELEKVSTQLTKDNIQSRNYFFPSLETVYGSLGEIHVESQHASESILCLPMHANLEMSDVDRVIKSLKFAL